MVVRERDSQRVIMSRIRHTQQQVKDPKPKTETQTFPIPKQSKLSETLSFIYIQDLGSLPLT